MARPEPIERLFFLASSQAALETVSEGVAQGNEFHIGVSSEGLSGCACAAATATDQAHSQSLSGRNRALSNGLRRGECAGYNGKAGALQELATGEWRCSG